MDDLHSMQVEIEEYGHKLGLDFFPIDYEVVDWIAMSQLAALGGFPLRYPHWSFGMEYDRLSKSYNYGLHRIYEMILNTNPCVAYLLTSNKRVDQKLVMAHCCGHSHFFKNNMWFSHNRHPMLNEMSNHAVRVQRYVDRHGLDKVEKFLDACLSIDNLIDMHSVAINRRTQLDARTDIDKEIDRIPSGGYMDYWMNPPEWLESQRFKKRLEKVASELSRNWVVNPERDVLSFLINHAPLENWEQDILDIIREERYYFVPQGQTKIMNEGFAVFCHSRIMTKWAMLPDELVDYADHYSSGVAMHFPSLNPYRLGYFLMLDIEDRWNRGAFGDEYERCTNMKARDAWDQKLGLGLEKLFEVVRIYNDVGFLDEFLTEDFARKNLLFTWEYDRVDHLYKISSRDFAKIKKYLLRSLTNSGQPIIEVTDDNFDNKGELYLVHRDEGVDVDVAWASETLPMLYSIWRRGVHFETIVTQYDEKGQPVGRKVVRYSTLNGKTVDEKELKDA